MDHNIVKEICNYLSDKEIIQFLSTNKWLCLLKNKMRYVTYVTDQMQHLPYYNNFINISSSMCTYITWPKNIEHLLINTDEPILYNMSLVKKIKS